MSQPFAVKHKNLFLAALADLVRRPLRTLVVVLCLTAMLFPVVTALAISAGLKYQAEISLKEGPDVYLSGNRYGNGGPVSSELVQRISALDGVTKVVPRVLGRTYFVDMVVAVVGLPRESLRELGPLVQGDMCRSRGEVLIGHGVAEEFGAKPGLRFTLAANTRKVFKVAGVLRPSCLWGSNLLVMHIDDANEFFRVNGQVSQLLVYGECGAVLSNSGTLRPDSPSRGRAQADFVLEPRQKSLARLERGYGYGSGIFSILTIVGVSLAVPAFLVTTGIGLTELRREIGVMTAMGWRAREILEKVAFENLAVSLLSVCFSVLISMIWIKGLNGILIAQFYIAEVGLVPVVDIPSRTLPSHVLFCLLLALGVTQVGGLISVYTKLVRPPGESMR